MWSHVQMQRHSQAHADMPACLLWIILALHASHTCQSPALPCRMFSQCMYACISLSGEKAVKMQRTVFFFYIFSFPFLHCIALHCFALLYLLKIFCSWKGEGHALHHIHTCIFFLNKTTNAKQSAAAACCGCDPIQSNPSFLMGRGEKVVATCHPSWTVCLPISILVGRFIVADSITITGSSAGKQILH
jgi:hypothetical protein